MSRLFLIDISVPELPHEWSNRQISREYCDDRCKARIRAPALHRTVSNLGLRLMECKLKICVTLSYQSLPGTLLLPNLDFFFETLVPEMPLSNRKVYQQIFSTYFNGCDGSNTWMWQWRTIRFYFRYNVEHWTQNTILFSQQSGRTFEELTAEIGKENAGIRLFEEVDRSHEISCD